MIHLVDSTLVAPQPWRNGGGSTRELFTWPGGTAPWQLRISVADIDQNGIISDAESHTYNGCCSGTH